MVGEDVRSRWSLDPSVIFLNHGSFGACPKVVQEAQVECRARMEAEPVRFFVDDLPALLDEAREAVARFVGADARDVVFVRNATSGVNAILRSLRFSAGDEILATDHGYHACSNTLDFVADRTGAVVRIARIPFPLAHEDDAVAPILAAATERTRLALVDHVTSPTGLVLPIERIVRELSARGVPVLVDGAHAPGMLPLDLRTLGASYYTGNFHKWVCAPKGAAFLWVRRDLQPGVHPTVISHGYDVCSTGARSRFFHEFDWTGTDDPSPWLCVPTAIGFVETLLPGGLPALRAHNRALAIDARAILCDALDVPPPAPDSMIGSLAAVPLPDGPADGPHGTPLTADPLAQALLARHRIQVPIPPWPAPPRRLVRISAQAYNQPAQYRALADALREVLAQE